MNLQDLIKEKNELLETAVNAISSLSLGSPDKKANKIDVNELEWKFGGNPMFNAIKSEILDSDDDSDPGDDPNLNDNSSVLKELAQKEVPSKLSSQQIQEHLEPHTIKLSHKIDAIKSPKKFVPFITAKSDALPDNLKDMKKIAGHKLAPEDLMPIPKQSNAKTKLIPVEESLQIIDQHNKHVKAVKIKHAAEKQRLKEEVQNHNEDDDDHDHDYDDHDNHDDHEDDDDDEDS